MIKPKFLLFAALLATATIAKSDPIRLALQSCLNLEYANAAVNTPKNISQSDAYKKGYSHGFDFLSHYKKSMQQLSNAETAIPEMLSIATNAGYNMAQNLTKEQILRGLKECRDDSSIDFGTKNITNENEIILIKRIKKLANKLNTAFIENGLGGLSDLVSSCYAEIAFHRYDCLVLDIGAIYIAGYQFGEIETGFFSDDAHTKRVKSAINNKYYRLNDVLTIKKVTLKNIDRILTSDINSRN